MLRQAADAPAVAKPLRQLLQTLDDRRRAVESDARAKATDPPAPDKTHVPASRQAGFTGMEAFWNYYYWQGSPRTRSTPSGVCGSRQRSAWRRASNYENVHGRDQKVQPLARPLSARRQRPDPTGGTGRGGERSSPRSSGRPASQRGAAGLPRAPVAGRGTHAVLDYLVMP